MTAPITLYEDDGTKVVQLSSHYNPTWDESINELKVIFLSEGIELHRFKNGEEQEMTRLDMTSEEADTFCSAWMTFQAEQGIKAMAEKQRIQNIVLEALKLIEGHPISLTKHSEHDENNPYWEIRCPEIDSIHYTAYAPEQLLPYVKDAVAVRLHHLKAQTWIEEAHKIAKDSHVIHITEGNAPWHVSIPEPDIFGQWACDPAHLLEVTKKAKEVYGRWQTEQDELIKAND
jgi:hypothetical protein